MTIFTDVTLKKARECERQSCDRIISAGESGFNIDDGAGHVKIVCSGCYKHYLDKEANAKAKKTGMKNSTVQPTSWSMPPPSLSVDRMRKSVNEAWRQGAHAPGGRVTALPAPTVSRDRYRSTDHRSGSAIGYSAAHSQHASQADLWFQRATRGVSSNPTGILTLTCFVYQPNSDSKGKNVLVPGIKESIRVQSDISTRELSVRIRRALEGEIYKLCNRHGISFNIGDMVLRDATGNAWLRVDPDSDAPYWGNQFLKADTRSKKAGGMVFHIPAALKHLIFGLVFEGDVWSRLDAALDAEIFAEMGGQSELSHRPTRKAITPARLIGGSGRAGSSRIASSGVSKRPRQFLPTVVQSDSESEENPDVHKSAKRPRKAAKNVPSEVDDSDVQEISDTEPEIGDQGSCREGSQKERSDDEGQDEVQVATPVSAGTTRRSSMDGNPGIKPFTLDVMRRAFLEGGVSSTREVDKDLLRESILFVDLPQLTFQELLDEPKKLRGLMLGVNAPLFEAYLRYNPQPKAFIGKGAFKTTSLARLTFRGGATPPNGLGKLAQAGEGTSDRSVQVALKRPWRSPRAANKRAATVPKMRAATAPQKIADSSIISPVGRLESEKEQDVVFDECKLLVWANSLLTAAYDWILGVIHDRKEEPPFQILEFRFVAAGMALSTKPIETKGGKPSTTWKTYLLEELMPTATVDFVKYLHNGSAATDLAIEDPDYVFAEFLMFLQHVQYMITGGIAYVSDLQGVGLLLTDPQILTSPLIGENLFGDGNIGESFEQFPDEHNCNEYCDWFKLTSPFEIRRKFQENLAS